MKTDIRTTILAVVTLLVAAQTHAQERPIGTRPPGSRARAAEIAMQQAIEQLAAERKVIEKEMKILGHLHAADEALIDPMQPTIAVQKAYEQLGEAQRLNSTDFRVRSGIIEARQSVDDARKSPTTADFARLRATVRREAIGPAARYAAKISAAMQEETLAWLKVQASLTEHLNALAEISGETLRAAMK